MENQKKLKVLMIGPDRSVHGGISGVVNNYYEAGLDRKIDLCYIGTMVEGSKFRKLGQAAKAFCPEQTLALAGIRRCCLNSMQFGILIISKVAEQCHLYSGLGVLAIGNWQFLFFLLDFGFWRRGFSV